MYCCGVCCRVSLALYRAYTHAHPQADISSRKPTTRRVRCFVYLLCSSPLGPHPLSWLLHIRVSSTVFECFPTGRPMGDKFVVRCCHGGISQSSKRRFLRTVHHFSPAAFVPSHLMRNCCVSISSRSGRRTYRCSADCVQCSGIFVGIVQWFMERSQTCHGAHHASSMYYVGSSAAAFKGVSTLPGYGLASLGCDALLHVALSEPVHTSVVSSNCGAECLCLRTSGAAGLLLYCRCAFGFVYSCSCAVSLFVHL